MNSVHAMSPIQCLAKLPRWGRFSARQVSGRPAQPSDFGFLASQRSVSHGTYSTVADVTYVSSSKKADATGRRTTCGGPP
jgi:hypothetical protein